jgi:hypothetical protein
MTQFVAFSEASSDGNTILGGTQGNGSPATQSALASTSWLNVNAGDGGYTAINPSNANEWFVSNPPDTVSGVNIFRCESGISCHTQDFQNDQVVSSATLDGDTGAYYPPYILDPQDSSELIVGTCRMWRGSSAGTGFTLLSNDFENGGAGICTGGETNLVRSLAAGGPLDSNGFSNVMYAGTDGYGPLIPTTPAGGHVWVSTNVAGGTSTWIDQTASINPSAFPISGVAMDSSDATGLTAYVTIMGFHVSHLWKTTNGGASWTDFSGVSPNSLPDAPANAVLVDPGTNPLTGTVYVGTDVGVFSSSTSAASWTEVGPAPSSGQAGYLPNVAVTALRMFNDGTDKWLRASTYGRGVWQFPLIITPDFALSVSNTPLTVFAGSQATFDGVASALDNYAYSVNLSCTAGLSPPPPTCSVSPNSVTPTGSGTSFYITAAGPDGTYSFTVQGVGTDPNSITHDAPVTFNVVDFNLTVPSVSSVTMGPAATSAPITFQVTAAGPFSQTVSLSCSGLPSGATCNFFVGEQPVTSVTPNASSPAAVTLLISTAPNATAGTFAVTISGVATIMNYGVPSTSTISPPGPPLTLTVLADYEPAVTSSSLTANVNSTVQFNDALITPNGYSSPVNLSCGTGKPPTCTVAPASVTPTAAGASLAGGSFTVTMGSNQCGVYDFNILAQGTDAHAVSHTVPVTFTVTSLAPPDYTLEITNASLTEPINTSATYNGTLTATACYSSAVKLSCGSGAPPTCTPSPASLIPDLNGAPFTVTVSSTVASAYNFAIVGVGTDPKAIQQEKLVSFTSTGANSSSSFDFSLVNASGQESIKAGQTATYNLQLAPCKVLPCGATAKFPDAVTLSVSGCPPLSTCSLSQTSVVAGSGTQNPTLNVQTTAAVAARTSPFTSEWQLLYTAWLWLPGLMLTVCGGTPGRDDLRKPPGLLVSVVAMAALLWLLAACGGGLQGGGTASANPGTPAGTYNMTVSAAMNSAPGSPSRTVSVTLTVN